MKNELNDFPVLKSLQSLPLWEVPEGYFEALEDNLMNQISVNFYLNKEKALETPPSYFDTFADKVILQIQMSELEAENTEVPEGYFEQLDTNIMNKIAAESTTSMILSTIPKPKVEVVEYQYFLTLGDKIMQQIKADEKTPQPSSRILSFVPAFENRFRKAIVGIAAILVISFGIFLYQTHQNKSSFAGISDSAIITYLSEDPNLEDLDIIQQVSLSPIEVQLPQDRNSKFEGISDEDILNYL